MATITLRVEDQVKDDLEALARSRGITVTDLLRPLVEGAAGQAGESRGVHPAHLTAVERRTMSLLHQVLGKLDPEDESYHRLRAAGARRGLHGRVRRRVPGHGARAARPRLRARQGHPRHVPRHPGQREQAEPQSPRGPGARRRSLSSPASTPTTRSRAGCCTTPATCWRPTAGPTWPSTSTTRTTAGTPTTRSCRPTGGCWRHTSPCSRPRPAAGAWGRITSCSAPTSWPRSPGPPSTHQSAGPPMPPIASRYASSSTVRPQTRPDPPGDGGQARLLADGPRGRGPARERARNLPGQPSERYGTPR